MVLDDLTDRGRPGRAVAGRAGGPGADHRDQPGRAARRAPGPGPPGRGVQPPGGAELPDGPPDRRPDQRLGAIDLVEDLGCEPMALAQASGVIATSSLSCRDYQGYFTARRDQLAEATAGSKPPAAAVSWLFSVEQADRLAPGGAAQPVLALAALLDGARDARPPCSARARRRRLPGRRHGRRRPGRPASWPRNALPILERTALLALDRSASPADGPDEPGDPGGDPRGHAGRHARPGGAGRGRRAGGGVARGRADPGSADDAPRPAPPACSSTPGTCCWPAAATRCCCAPGRAWTRPG